MNARTNVSLTARLLSAASAAAVSLTLLAGPGAAQELGLRQLQDSAVNSLAMLGMDTSVVPGLTLDELTQIEAISGAGERDATKKGRIETVLRNAEERIAAGGAAAPVAATGDVSAPEISDMMVVKEQVTQKLAQLGLTNVIDVDTLTDEQLMQVQLLTSGNGTSSDIRQQLETVIAK